MLFRLFSKIVFFILNFYIVYFKLVRWQYSLCYFYIDITTYFSVTYFKFFIVFLHIKLYYFGSWRNVSAISRLSNLFGPMFWWE